MFFEDHLDEALSRGSSTDSGVDNDASKNNGNEALLLPSSSGFGSLLKSLIQATENERCAPDILPYPEAVVDGVAAQIAAQNEQIKRLSEEEKQKVAEGESGASLLPFKQSDIMALEVQRAQFFLCELLRCRLRKIEALSQSIFYEGQSSVDAPTQLRGMLSHNEVIVADRLAEAAGKCVMQAGLQSAPAELQHLFPSSPYGEGMEILPLPDLDRYVFCVVLEDLGVVRLGEDAVQTVHAGEIFLVPYRSFRPYIVEGRARLV
ncbi:GINS complex subunit 4 [Trypanosoma grayi]|uniref:GINS complex subunit 4 n=1 Tax=Trypanosoma grayi TaxID=71804 RepID=UPI0004F45417|nr:GINS complex subunit 4 [Trypanosoma grayi]KEG14627.1 GINS complex subunit 4 [Trypanosoma grayi]